MTEEQRATIKTLAKGYTSISVDRAPILETPKDYGLAYEDVKFKTEDGLELAVWFDNHI